MNRLFLLLVAVIVGIVLAVVVVQNKFVAFPQPSPNYLSTRSSSPSSTFSPQPSSAPDLPQTLDIPKVGIDAPVEEVGLDSQNRMDVPKVDTDVAWYDLGAKPGQTGNAVIDGHLDTVTGAPAAFWNLSKLQNGDQIIVTDQTGHKYSYKVTDKEYYDWNAFPLQLVFGSTDKAMLNLITCEGVWNAQTHNYSQRLVIFSRLDSSS